MRATAVVLAGALLARGDGVYYLDLVLYRIPRAPGPPERLGKFGFPPAAAAGDTLVLLSEPRGPVAVQMGG